MSTEAKPLPVLVNIEDEMQYSYARPSGAKAQGFVESWNVAPEGATHKQSHRSETCQEAGRALLFVGRGFSRDIEELNLWGFSP